MWLLCGIETQTIHSCYACKSSTAKQYILKSTVLNLHMPLFNSYQVALMAPFDLLVDNHLLKAGWRSASIECGGQCAIIAGDPMMPELCADS